MIVGFARETFPGERRVALVTASVQPLIEVGFEVMVEQGAGDEAGFLTSEYSDKGASVETRDEVFPKADIILQVIGPGIDADAGIPNPLFAADNCLMMFGDGKKALTDLVTALEED